MKLRWSRRALADIAHMHAYMADENPAAARRMEAKIRRRAAALAAQPFTGIALGIGDMRRALVRGAPYVLLYTVRTTDLVIEAVFHQSQNYLP